jgi:hypothetical protein
MLNTERQALPKNQGFSSVLTETVRPAVTGIVNLLMQNAGWPVQSNGFVRKG